MPTSTSLSLQALLKTATHRAGFDTRTRVVSGLTEQAQALWVATAAHELPRGTVLHVVPVDRDVEQAVQDVRFFLAALEGASDEVGERVVLPFTSHEVDPYRGMTPHIGVTAARARALHALAAGTARVIVASAAALLPRVSSPDRLLRAALDLTPGQDIAPGDLADTLIDAGFSREDPADEHGEFARRGGILDVFPAAAARPVRIEFIGDTIESLRAYDPATQRSVAAVDRLSIAPLRDVLGDDRSASLFDYLAKRETRVMVAEPEDVASRIDVVLEQLQRSFEDPARQGVQLPPPNELFATGDDVRARLNRGTSLVQLAVDLEEPSDPAHLSHPTRFERSHVSCQPAMEWRGRVGDFVADLRRLREQGETVLLVAATHGRAERVVELLKEYDLLAAPVEHEEARYATVLVAVGRLSRGFRLGAASLQIYAETDVFEEERRVSERRRSATAAFLSDLRDLKVGDHVVHVDHGIGVFVGLKQIGVGDATQEFLELRYAGEDKLFVPVERLDLIQKYTGSPNPPVDKLGGTSWERAKTRVRKAMRDMAEELLKLYAARKAVKGHAFSPDSHWQKEFEDAFEYELTPDQRTAIADIKRDMESSTPMDRLLCGDVGYGKTEVAMRAAFKAVMDGKQVAFLAPTTVLAFQHEKTLKERFAGFPVRIDMVSRFRSRAEQQATLADLNAGKVDIIVGTHRLLSKDVIFRDLGLLVVDEEQRFGVAHKERIKQLRRQVDVLTMTATPIPRTLNMSLVGIRDMSVIETPPKDRLSIQTSVVKFDQNVITRAVRQELARGGQVYFVHNRVESIFSIGALLQRLVPEARVAVAHGQMGEDTLERAMLDFVARRFDVLLATTIVENGLDIPNANTIVINRADRYGLSQLYQLRGRVGRSDRPAYAYLLIPPEDALSAVAKKRLAAIKEFSDLGSGFRVAALDLEIRGAGTLLGGEQSGHIETVGFEMYTKLLEEAVRQLRGEDIEDEARATVNLGIDLRIDDSYIPDMNQRLMLYRKVAGARAQRDVEAVVEEAIDRYGPPPDAVLNLADYGRIRVLADQLGIERIDREGQAIVLRFKGNTKVELARLVTLVRERRDLTLLPPAALKLSLEQAPGSGLHTPGRVGGRVLPDPPSRDAGHATPKAQSPKPRAQRPKSDMTPSWWTSRARAGEVKPGFSRDQILRPERNNPREADVFEKVSGLLSTLAGQK